ncbi:MAG TPA: thioredoxin domain-containing protein [Thermodesulfobacteriota bacterium]|nr:thioredoxin domain-containing protein [Thermodesulfobacteriota bacterium]
MKKKVIIFGGIGVVILVGALLFYLFYLDHPTRQTLATVNGEKISLEQFNQDMAKVENPLREMYQEEPEKFVEGMIVRTLLLQEAKRQGISPPVKTYKDAAKDSLSSEDALIGELMKKKFSTPPAVSKEEIEAFYAVFKGQMEGKKMEQVAPAIEQVIREGKQQQAVEEYLKELRSNAKVEMEQERLKKIAAKPPESNSEEEFKKALTSGKPVMVDFGANNCVPCRQMRPILKELSKEYAGKAEILVIDVYKYQGLAKDYKVALIPTLVFFDAKGKEVFRQMGAMEKETIVAKFKEIGIGT